MSLKKSKELNYQVSKSGYYGEFGGSYVPELLAPALKELEDCFNKAKKDKKFLKELSSLHKDYIGRPTPLYFCKNLTKELGGAKIFIKNEGAAHTGAHKINHCVGQVLLAKRMKKSRVVAETGAGQHGIATASVCAKFGLDCTIYMGEVDIKRQRPNVFWMEQLGAKVVSVETGTKSLKDAVGAALKDWTANIKETHYLLGSCVGPYPYTEINRYFQKIVGKEIKAQLKAQEGTLPDYVIACVGGGSNATGAFDVFLKEDKVKLIGVEGAGAGVKTRRHASRFHGGKVGIIEGYKTYWLQDKDGNLKNTYSVSAGLDYAGISPFHAFLHDTGRVQYENATDVEVLNAFKMLLKHEGILPALESSHALAYAIKLAPTLPKTKKIVVNLSGRGDKDIFIVAQNSKDKCFEAFCNNFSISKK